MLWIKICGVTTPADAAFAAGCGADAVGLNFYPKSRRFVTEEQAAAIVRELPPTAAAVGVFVDAHFDEIKRSVGLSGLRAVQDYAPARDRYDFHPAVHVPAFRVRDESHLDAIEQYLAGRSRHHRPPMAVLIDAFVPGEMGGTGHQAPWELIAQRGFDLPVILAGGLTSDNVADAIRTVRPSGVDVASGVESAPGRKDPGKVRAFVQAAREAAAGLESPPPVFRLRGGPGDLE
jgi:phosphoribosylanthranilate isomerase